MEQIDAVATATRDPDNPFLHSRWIDTSGAVPIVIIPLQGFTSQRMRRLFAARQRGTHTAIEWDFLCAYCKGCVRCLDRFVWVPSLASYRKPDNGLPQDQWERLTKDHIEPISGRGTDAIENIQPLCRRCNSKKGVRSHDWRPAGWPEAIRCFRHDGYWSETPVFADDEDWI